MNELQMIRSVLDKPPASDAVVAAGRDRLRAAARSPRRRERMPRPRWTAGFVLAAAAAAAAFAVAVSGTATKPPDSTRPTAQQQLSGRQVLLAAATRAEQVPTTGAYWHLRTMDAQRRPAPGREYLLEERHAFETWIPSAATEPTWLISQQLGARPATPEDTAAWRRDGSPSSFPVPGGACKAGGRSCAMPGPEAPVATKMPKRYGVGRLGNFTLRLAEARALPADPERLKAVLTKRLAGGNAKINEDIVLFEAGMNLITGLPVSSEVRAAAYRMMAALPGVRSQGSMKDALGRSGQAVSMVGEDRGIAERLIIDPRTGLPLAIERVRVGAPGAAVRLQSYQMVLSLRWTNEKPRLPERRYG